MTSPPTACPKCQGPMEEGFALDRGHYDSKRVAQWVEGQPERSFWSGIKTKDRRIFEVSVFRCERCGFLESYATHPKDGAWGDS